MVYVAFDSNLSNLLEYLFLLKGTVLHCDPFWAFAHEENNSDRINFSCLIFPIVVNFLR